MVYKKGMDNILVTIHAAAIEIHRPCSTTNGEEATTRNTMGIKYTMDNERMMEKPEYLNKRA